MKVRQGIIVLSITLSFLVCWTAHPTTCSAQCYQVPPVQVYNYSLLPQPTYAYTLPAPEPVGYAVAYPAPHPHKYKYKHKHKHKHKCKRGCYYAN